MKKTVTTACFMLVSGGVLWAWTNGAWLRTGPQEWPRVENMTPAEASPADDTEALEQAKEALEKLMSEAEVNKDRDGALKEAYENAAQKLANDLATLKEVEDAKNDLNGKISEFNSKKVCLDKMEEDCQKALRLYNYYYDDAVVTDSIFIESNFGEDASKVADTLKYIANTVLTVEKVEEIGKGTDLTDFLKIAEGKSNNYLVEFSRILEGYMNTILSGGPYESLKTNQAYTEVYKWTYTENGTLSCVVYKEDAFGEMTIEVKDSTVSYYMINGETCNLTKIKTYSDQLEDAIRMVDLKELTKTDITQTTNTLNTYFKKDERNDDTPAWKTVNDQIEKCKSANERADITYEELDSIRVEMTNSLSTLNTLRTENRNKLEEEIGKAELLLAQIVESEDRKDLSEAVNHAKDVFNELPLILSVYTEEAANLDAKYAVSKNYYDNLAVTLNGKIEEAQQGNETWQDSDLSAAITQAEGVHAGAGSLGVKDSEIKSATTALEKACELAANRGMAKQRIVDLKECLATYSDEDGALQALIERTGQVTNETAEKLWSDIDAKIEDRKNESEECKRNLQEMIDKAQSYYDRWNISLSLETLKTTIESAKKTLGETENISELKQAYDTLYKVYDNTGGTSDPYEYQLELEKLINNATELNKKYNYDPLKDKILAADAVKNSLETYVLQNYIVALENEIKQTLNQYQILVKRLDAYLIESVYGKMEERYAEDIPDKYAGRIKEVEDALVAADDESGDRVCTDMNVLSGYLRDLQTMVSEADAEWQQAVADLKKAIDDTKLKYDQNYSSNEPLNQAIKAATDEYNNIDTDERYSVIANVKNIRTDLDNALMKVEGTARRGVANDYIGIYDKLVKNFETYGSDKYSVPTSNVGPYLEENKEFADELRQEGLITYSLELLIERRDRIKQVEEAYNAFCKANEELAEEIVVGREEMEVYYGEQSEGTGLYKALERAEWARTESCCLDSLVKFRLNLRDSVSVTVRKYQTTLSNMKSLRISAKNKHAMYYGAADPDSEILDIYNIATDYIEKEEKNIFTLQAMVERLDTCYAYAADSCAKKETAIQAVIDRAKVLNALMANLEFGDKISNAINARYAMDARIAAITGQMEVLEQAYEEQLELYVEAADAMRKTVETAAELLERTADESLAGLLAQAEDMVGHLDPMEEGAVVYAELIAATGSLKGKVDELNQMLADNLACLHKALADAREDALSKHVFYYGADRESSEIMDVYRRSESYLEYTDTMAICLMTDTVSRCHREASVACSKKEAEILDVIGKSEPLVVLMADQTIAEAISRSQDALEVEDGRIPALEAVWPELSEKYKDNAALYDRAMLALNDSIIRAEALLLQVKDEALKAAVALAEGALSRADKTSEAATLYADLQLTTVGLAKEIERVRKELEATSIYKVYADSEEVPVYTLQGRFVKKVRLADEDAFRGMPEGIYIVGGKKMYIKEK